MMRTSIVWATLAWMAVVLLAENASPCPWRSGRTCCQHACHPPSSSAILVVRLPADAKVFFDDQPTTSRGATRVFITPPLNPSKTFTYTIRAEVNQGGQTVTKTKKVAVRASCTTEVDFSDMTDGANGDEEEFGADLPKLQPLPRLPDLPSLESLRPKLD